MPLARSWPKGAAPGTGRGSEYQSANKNRKPCIARLQPPVSTRLSRPSATPFWKTRLYYCFCHTLRLAKSCACFSSCVDIYVAVINFKLHAFWAAASSSNYELSGEKIRNSHSHLHLHSSEFT